MKTLYLTVGTVLIISTSALAQIFVGPEVGINYSWTSFKEGDLKEEYKMNPVPGYHVGGHLGFKVRNRFFLHSSLLYSTKGRELTGKSDKLLKSTSHYNYIEMPINFTVDFKGKIGKSKEFKYFVGIGPNVSYWLGGKGTFYNSELEENNAGELSYKIRFKEPNLDDQPADEMRVQRPNRLQLGLNFIAGMVFEPWYKQRFMFSVRYERGHSYIAKSNGEFSSIYFADPLKSRSQGFRVSLAYLVDLKTEERKKGKSTIDKRKLNGR